MGSLRSFNLKQYIDTFQLTGFIETGLGWGHGIQYARTFEFEKLYSIEISPQVVIKYYNTYKHDCKIETIVGNSIDGLELVFEQKIASQFKYLIFLDAHFPAADLGVAGFNDEKDNSIKYPLLNELKIIKELRADKGFKDVIIIDDLSFYSKSHKFPDSHLISHFGITPPDNDDCLDLIMNYFNETHESFLIEKFSGFGVFVPR